MTKPLPRQGSEGLGRRAVTRVARLATPPALLGSRLTADSDTCRVVMVRIAAGVCHLRRSSTRGVVRIREPRQARRGKCNRTTTMRPAGPAAPIAAALGYEPWTRQIGRHSLTSGQRPPPSETTSAVDAPLEPGGLGRGRRTVRGLVRRGGRADPGRRFQPVPGRAGAHRRPARSLPSGDPPPVRRGPRHALAVERRGRRGRRRRLQPADARPRPSADRRDRRTGSLDRGGRARHTARARRHGRPPVHGSRLAASGSRTSTRGRRCSTGSSRRTGGS